GRKGARRAEAQAERESCHTYPSYRRSHRSSPCRSSCLSVANPGRPWASATGPMAEDEVSPPHNSTESGPSPLSARMRLLGKTEPQATSGMACGSWFTALRLHCTALHRLGTAPTSGMEG